MEHTAVKMGATFAAVTITMLFIFAAPAALHVLANLGRTELGVIITVFQLLGTFFARAAAAIAAAVEWLL